MLIKSGKNWTPKKIPMGIAIGLLGSVVVMLLGCAVLTTLIDRSIINETGMGYVLMLTLLLASVTGSLLSSKLVGHDRLPVCAGSAGAYFALLLGCNALFFDGQYDGVWATLLLVIAGSMSVCLLAFRGGKRHISGRRKVKNR